MTTRIIVNQAQIDSVPEQLFERPVRDRAARGESGRGTIITFHHADQDMVLKSYFRGGLPGRFIRETYLYTGLERTRMWREFRLLLAMRELGLPVPVPLAARCELTTPFSYRGDLIMEQIGGVKTLAELAAEAPVTEETWHQIGEVLARFHNHRVYHRDLNASNILITDNKTVYVVDFDKCYFRGGAAGHGRGWTAANLKRLKHSLRKLTSRVRDFHFDRAGWKALLRGYESRASSYAFLFWLAACL